VQRKGIGRHGQRQLRQITAFGQEHERGIVQFVGRRVVGTEDEALEVQAGRRVNGASILVCGVIECKRDDAGVRSALLKQRDKVVLRIADDENPGTADGLEVTHEKLTGVM
jgi:hypothetical protein